MVWVGFWINDPSKIGRFHQHWEKLCWNAAIWRPCGQQFLLFLLCAYFCAKKSWIKSKCIFHKYQRKKFKKKLDFFLMCMKVPSLNPLTTLWLFSAIFFFFNFFSSFIENAFASNSRFFSQKYAHNKKERNFLPQVLQISPLCDVQCAISKVEDAVCSMQCALCQTFPRHSWRHMYTCRCPPESLKEEE